MKHIFAKIQKIMKTKIIYISCLALLTLLCFSCKIGQQYKQPELENMPGQFTASEKTDTLSSTANIGWSTMYNDPELQQLIAKAIKHNKDLKIAEAQIKELLQTNRISKANLLPDPGIELAYQREVYDYKASSTKVRAQATVAWELDIWGNLRWKNEASFAAYMQKVEAQKALQLTIVAQVAQTYFELNSLTKELSIVKQTLKARQDGTKFAQLRYEGGITSEIPYRQALVELSRTEVLIPILEKNIKLKEYDLSLLLGEYPSASIFRLGDLSKFPPAIELPVGLPSDILRRRPDVIQAEQMLVEANAKVGAALTDMFPRLSLTGKYGAENSELSNLIKNPASLLYVNLLGPVLNYPKNKAKHKGAQAVLEQKMYNYEKVIMGIFKEVNGAIIGFDKSKTVRVSQEKLYQSALSYYNLANLQYVNGVVSYLDVLDSQRQLFDAEIGLNKAILNEQTSLVTLYKALGGGLIE